MLIKTLLRINLWNLCKRWQRLSTLATSCYVVTFISSKSGKFISSKLCSTVIFAFNLFLGDS